LPSFLQLTALEIAGRTRFGVNRRSRWRISAESSRGSPLGSHRFGASPERWSGRSRWLSSRGRPPSPLFKALLKWSASGAGKVRLLSAAEKVGNPGLKLTYLVLGMLFKISNCLAQAFRIVLRLLRLHGFDRFGCIPCAGEFLAPPRFRFVILIHAFPPQSGQSVQSHRVGSR
jgi:hypothetical protein